MMLMIMNLVWRLLNLERLFFNNKILWVFILQLSSDIVEMCLFGRQENVKSHRMFLTLILIYLQCNQTWKYNREKGKYCCLFSGNVRQLSKLSSFRLIVKRKGRRYDCIWCDLLRCIQVYNYGSESSKAINEVFQHLF